jgi:hypothetical protein
MVQKYEQTWSGFHKGLICLWRGNWLFWLKYFLFLINPFKSTSGQSSEACYYSPALYGSKNCIMLQNSPLNKRCIWYSVDKFRTICPNFRNWTYWDIWRIRKRNIIRIFHLGSSYWRDRSKWLFVVINLKVSSISILDYWVNVPIFTLLLACTQ